MPPRCCREPWLTTVSCSANVSVVLLLKPQVPVFLLYTIFIVLFFMCMYVCNLCSLWKVLRREGQPSVRSRRLYMCQVTQGVSPRAPDKGSRQSGCGRADGSRRDKHLTSLWLLAAGWRSHLMMTPVTQQQLSLVHPSMIWKWRMTPLSCVAPTQMTMFTRNHREHYCRQVPASTRVIADVCICQVCSGVGVGDTPPYGCNPVCRQDK